MPMANGVGKICYKKRGLSMSAIAIITARGGSKRIPKKNIKELLKSDCRLLDLKDMGFPKYWQSLPNWREK